jgi:hypothetical protein
MVINLINNTWSLTEETKKHLFQNNLFWNWYRNNIAVVSERVIKNAQVNAWAFGGASEMEFDLLKYYREHPYDVLEAVEKLAA